LVLKTNMPNKMMATHAKHPRKTLAARVLGKGTRVRKGLGRKMASGGKVGPR
jgi:hypothetical protein